MKKIVRRVACVLLLIVSSVMAEEQKVLRLLVWEGHAPKEHVAAFETLIATKYGTKVKLQISYIDGSDEYYASIRRNSVDVVMLTHHQFKDERYNFIKSNLLLPIDLKNIPNYSKVMPALQKADYLTSEGQLYGVPEAQGPYGLAYNTTLLKETPKSWNILWDPQYKGKYVIGANEYVYNAMITALALGYPKESLGSYDTLNNSAFREKFRQLAVNAHSFWIGVDKADDLSGHALATAWGDSFTPLKKRGEQWQMAEPAEGIPFWIDNFAITSALKDKPFLKKVAEEYINCLLTTDYQVGHIMRVVGTMPVITEIDALITPEEKRRIQLAAPDVSKSKRVMVPTCSQRDRNGLRLLWKEAMTGIVVKEEKE